MSVHSDMELLLLTTETDKALLAAAVRVQKALTRAHSLLEASRLEHDIALNPDGWKWGHRLTSWAFTTAAIGTGVWVGGIVGTWLGWWS